VTTSAEALAAGRESYAAGAWAAAFERLTGAERESALGGEDLERLAAAAYMLGREDEYFLILERAHHAHLDAGENLRAARCAFWIGVNLARRGAMSRAGGWLGRAQRLVDREGGECVEQGYLLIPTAFRHEAAGDFEAAIAVLAEAVEIAHRFDEPDLFALAVHEHGHTLILHGRGAEGLGLLDEAMVAVTAGELSPIVSGIVYCGVILGCQDAHEPRRAGEWTAALTEWCERQPDMVAFTGRCLVHRAELLQLQGAWPAALEEARRAQERSIEGQNDGAAAEAVYRQADVHRLRGELDLAEAAYREASRSGREPQPGLALLRLVQGNGDAAAAAIRRATAEATDASKRAALLPAQAEIMVAAGDLDSASAACTELEEIATAYNSDLLAAGAGQARGSVMLASGDAHGALAALRKSARLWQELGAPYELARVRALVAQACRALGDSDAAELELEAARESLERLGATSEVARLGALSPSGAPADAHGLTARELEVLRLVAAGHTNKAIAAELVVSDRTVDRHVSNIYAKLGVSSRSAATAYAYEHDLV
jgi:DNA-binding CsgD family transcriptional regulator